MKNTSQRQRVRDRVRERMREIMRERDRGSGRQGMRLKNRGQRQRETAT